MVMPTRYRERMLERSEGRVVVTIDRDGCLLLYPMNDWEQIERQIMQLPLRQASRSLQRLMVGHATDVELDAHGRLLLPPELREFAALTRYAMLIGQGNRCELWDEARWIERRTSMLASGTSASELPAELDSLSL
jgi:MraZ protein